MKLKPHLTTSKLYNYLQYPHRVWRDIHSDQSEKIKETNPFVQLLWDKGMQHEKEVVGKLGEFVDLGEGEQQERITNTKQALADGVELLYQPIIVHENLQ